MAQAISCTAREDWGRGMEQCAFGFFAGEVGRGTEACPYEESRRVSPMSRSRASALTMMRGDLLQWSSGDLIPKLSALGASPNGNVVDGLVPVWMVLAFHNSM